MIVWVLLRDQQRERGEEKGYSSSKKCLNGLRSVNDEDGDYGLPFAEVVRGCERRIVVCFFFLHRGVLGSDFLFLFLRLNLLS